MTRLTTVLVALLVFLPAASACLTPRTDNARSGDSTPPKKEKKHAPGKQKQDFVINDDTEIKVDGRACNYENVPRGAEIIRLDLAADQKVILKIHFRTRK